MDSEPLALESDKPDDTLPGQRLMQPQEARPKAGLSSTAIEDIRNDINAFVSLPKLIAWRSLPAEIGQLVDSYNGVRQHFEDETVRSFRRSLRNYAANPADVGLETLPARHLRDAHTLSLITLDRVAAACARLGQGAGRDAQVAAQYLGKQIETLRTSIVQERGALQNTIEIIASAHALARPHTRAIHIG